MLRSFLDRLRDPLVALLSFVLGTGLVRTVCPPEPEEQLGAKLEHFRTHKDEYDALFLGSSRVLRGIDTDAFDAELGAAGMELRSYNFGVRGMRTFEQDHLLHELLALEPRRLRWIFMESGPVTMALPGHHEYLVVPELFSARHVQWHTPRETRRMLASIRRLPVPPWHRLELALTHIGLCGRNLTNLGSISARLFESAEERELRAAQAAAGDGLEGGALFGDGASLPAERAAVHASAPYRALLARIVAENALSLALDELDPDFHPDQIAAAAARGIELVTFTMPGAEGSPEPLRLHELGVLPTLLHFNDPERHPELFRIENRLDFGHLNPRGAELFSRLFAARFLEHLRTPARGQ